MGESGEEMEPFLIPCNGDDDISSDAGDAPGQHFEMFRDITHVSP